ncbi:MAG: VTC domain-containing protein [Bacteroidota bacterium]
MPLGFNKNRAYRFERKFTATGADRFPLISQIKTHPAFFHEIYYTRQVNNIYFDTSSLKFYDDNKIGISERKKVRIRWYGNIDGKITSPKLEYKIKSGLLGTKWTFDLLDFEIGNNFSENYIFDILQRSNLPKEIAEDLKVLSPTLINSYHRTYFLSADQKYRLTFDEHLKFYRPSYLKGNPISFPKLHLNHFIVELKYAQSEDAHANRVSKLFPYRLDKSSKYVTGIDLTRI